MKCQFVGNIINKRADLAVFLGFCDDFSTKCHLTYCQQNDYFYKVSIVSFKSLWTLNMKPYVKLENVRLGRKNLTEKNYLAYFVTTKAKNKIV